MSDHSIRRLTIAEEAERAARRFVDTGEREPNPYAGKPEAQVWRSAYERYLLLFSTGEVSA